MFSKTPIHILLFIQEGKDDFIRDESFVNQQMVFHRADTASNAIALLLEFNIIAIIMDVDNKTHDYFQSALKTAELIRTSDRLKQVPIVFLLTNAPHPDQQFNKPGEGPIDYILKPVNKNILTNKLCLFAHLDTLKRSNTNLHPVHNLYRQFFENGPAAFLMLDKYGYILDLNTYFIKYIAKSGHDKLDYIGKHIFSQTDIIHSKILDMYKNILAGKRISSTDIVVSRKSLGLDKYYSVFGSPLLNNGEIDGIIIVYEDISERIEVENDLCHSKNELEKANSELQRMTEDLEKAISKANKMAVDAEIATISKSGFLASMSHEIRTPLNAVVGFTDLMLSTNLTDEQKEYIESIHDSSQTFLGLINDILDFSKIEANRVELENIPFNLESIMDEVLNTTGIRAYEKQIEIAQRISPDVPRQLKGDPVRLKQILINLIGNAVKFTTVGHILIRVSLVSKTTSNTIIRFSVSDTGIGIPPNKVERIFQPFSQASGSTTREFGGTGLGLAISKKLAELMQGAIRVESPNPESHNTPGTIFHVDLTFELSDENPLNQDGSHTVLQGKRTAVFSDDPALLNFYLQIFQDIGMIPIPITDANQIPELLYSENTSNNDFHIILIDDTIALSVIESSLCFNSTNKEFRKKTVLMSSPFSKIDQELSSRYPGLSSHVLIIKKPFKLSQLSKLISDSLKHGPDSKILANYEELQATSDSSLNVLLVEDNNINQKVATKMLKKMGHTVTVANNGKEAIDILQRESGFDLILMDGQMPVMDGFRATEIIRINEKSTPGKDRMPIIALTANAMKGDKDKYLNAGMDDYIAKPVKFSDLSTMISKTMERKKTGALAQRDPFTHPDVPEF